MATRMVMSSPRARKDGKTHWHAVGTAWIDDKGTTLEFDSLPLPDAEGRVRVKLFEPRDNSGAQQRRQPAYSGGYQDDGSDAPF